MLRQNLTSSNLRDFIDCRKVSSLRLARSKIWRIGMQSVTGVPRAILNQRTAPVFSARTTNSVLSRAAVWRRASRKRRSLSIAVPAWKVRLSLSRVSLLIFRQSQRRALGESLTLLLSKGGSPSPAGQAWHFNGCRRFEPELRLDYERLERASALAWRSSGMFGSALLHSLKNVSYSRVEPSLSPCKCRTLARLRWARLK